MSSDDWRDPANYELLRSLDAPGLAWEYLRRNPEFNVERARLKQEHERDLLTPERAEAFARRWGVRFRRCGRDHLSFIDQVDRPSASNRDSALAYRR
jgi:hypothetical protein